MFNNIMTFRAVVVMGLLIVICLLYLPFLNKAYHIDDPSFIDFSRMVGWNPLKAIPEDVPGMGDLMKGVLPYEATHPLLVPYLMKIGRAMFGEREFVMHLLFLIVPLTVAGAIVIIVRTLFPEAGEMATTAPLFFLSMPAFLVNSQNVMADAPTLAFLLVSFACYLYALEKNKQVYCYLGALFLLASAFSSYQMIVFFPLIGAYGLLRKRLVYHTIASLLIAIAAIFFWSAAIYLIYGIIPVLKSNLSAQRVDLASLIAAGHSREIFLGKVISIFAHIGASVFFVVMYCAIVSGRLAKTLLRFGCVSAVCLPVVLWVVSYSWGNAVLLSFLMGAGLLAVGDIIIIAVKGRAAHERYQELFLAGWALLAIAYNVLVLPFESSRYILPALLPVMLLYLSSAHVRAQRFRVKVLASCVIVLSVLFGFMASYVDYQYADSYRSFAGEIAQFRKDKGGTSDIWYVGEWGMRYYMDRNGARYLFHDSDEPKKGDYVVLAMMPRQWQPSLQVTKRLMLYATRDYPLRLPLRLFNLRANAGFYGHYWGLLPVSFSHEPLESFEIWEVVS